MAFFGYSQREVRQMRRQAYRETGRCMVCGEPLCDHLPARYWLRAWAKHKLARFL